jgi:hypothetical protein
MGTEQESTSYPFERDWSIDSLDIKRYTSLHGNWEKSTDLANSIRKCVDDKNLPVKTVAPQVQ